MEHKHKWHVLFSDLANWNLPYAYIYSLFPYWIFEKWPFGMISEAIWWRCKSNYLGYWITMWNRTHLPLNLPGTVLVCYVREKYTSVEQLYLWALYILQPSLPQLIQASYFCLDFLSLSTFTPKLLLHNEDCI